MCFCNPSIRAIYCDSVICSLAKRKNKIIHDVQDNSDLKLLLNDNAELLEVFNNDCMVNRCFKTFGVSESALIKCIIELSKLNKTYIDANTAILSIIDRK